MSTAQWHENNNEACRSDATPAQVTEAHLRLANQLVSSPPSPLVLATLIADSEAKATAQLRADRDYNHECINRLASATGTLGEKSERVVEGALSTIDQLRAEVERLTAGWDKYANMQIEMDALFARAEDELLAVKMELDQVACARTDGILNESDLQCKLNMEREKVRALHSALQNLADEQNGAPLERRREQWQMAMDEAGLALAATEATK